MPPAKKRKIVGLLPARNESRIIAQCITCLANITDAIVYLDDCSTDNSVKIVQSLAKKYNVKIVQKKAWIRDEPGDRNLLLDTGRKLGGTDFVVIDADEVFTANCTQGNFLRNKIMELEPGDQMSVNWIQLWRTTKQYRFDDSIWTNCYKEVIFRDDGTCNYQSGFIHTRRVPNNLSGKTVQLDEGYRLGLMHFQFVSWRNLLVKQSWYRCLERTRMPSRLIKAINTRYALSKNETGLGTKPSPRSWFAGYKGFDVSAYAKPAVWYEEHILSMFDDYGIPYFADLDIWDVNWGDRIAEDDVKSRKGLCFSQLKKARTILYYDFEKAAKLYRSIFKRFGANEAEFGLAECDRKMKNNKKALERCKNIMKKAPNYAPAYNLAGQIAWDARDGKNATRYFDKAMAIDPFYLDAQLHSDMMIWG